MQKVKITDECLECGYCYDSGECIANNILAPFSDNNPSDKPIIGNNCDIGCNSECLNICPYDFIVPFDTQKENSTN